MEFFIVFFSEELWSQFLPAVTSTPVHRIEYRAPARRTTADNEVHVAMNESMNVLSVRGASNYVVPKEGAIIRNDIYAQKQIKRLQGGNSQKNSDRLNRQHFYLKNIATSEYYLEVFISIVKKLHLAESNTTQNTTTLQYLCVAGNVLLI